MTEELDKPMVVIPDPLSEITKRYDRQTNLIIGVLIVALLTMVMMVGGLLLEAWHFNSATYKEYAARLEQIQMTENTNRLLLEEVRSHDAAIKSLEEKKTLIHQIDSRIPTEPATR
jgi:hypothetical protein